MRELDLEPGAPRGVSTATGWMFSSSSAFTVDQPRRDRRLHRFGDAARTAAHLADPSASSLVGRRPVAEVALDVDTVASCRGASARRVGQLTTSRADSGGVRRGRAGRPAAPVGRVGISARVGTPAASSTRRSRSACRSTRPLPCRPLRRRRSGRRSPARPGTAAGSGRSRRRRCRGRRSCRSARSCPPSLGRSRRPRRWASSWREPKEPETWIATSAEGRSMEKFATLETTSSPTSPVRKASKSRCRSLTGVSPLITGASRAAASSSSWSMYCPITSVGCAGVLRDQVAHDVDLVVGARRQPVALLGLGGRVDQPLVGRQGDPHLDAVGRRDPALRLDVLPRARRTAWARSARTRRPRGRPRAPASRSARSGAGPAGWRSSGRSAPAAGAPRRRRSAPSRGRRAARGAGRRPSAGWSSPGTSRW